MSLTTKSQPVPFIGNDLRGTFSFDVTGLDGYTPTMVNGIVLRMVGKLNENDPDESALFDIDSTAADVNGSRITISSNNGVIVSGTWYIDGAATRGMSPVGGANYKTMARFYYAFSATYAGDPTENIYLKGEQLLRTDTVIDRVA